MIRGIYILPNTFTAMNLLLGVWSILLASSGEAASLHTAAWLILLANLMDVMDGKVARWTNATSRFGMEFDSLADLVAFGVAPAVLVYRFMPVSADGFWARFVCAAYVLCGALRLARFNVQAQSCSSCGNFFTGCPIPAAASFLASSVLVAMQRGEPIDLEVAAACVAVAGFLMISTLPYPSLKKSGSEGGGGGLVFKGMLFLLLLFVLYLWREMFIFLVTLCYLASGPAWKLARTMYRVWCGLCGLKRRIRERKSGV